MPKLRKVSGHKALKILCNRFSFKVSGRAGSHVRLFKITPKGKIGTVIPMHKQLKIGTIKNVLKLAKVSEEEFSEYL